MMSLRKAEGGQSPSMTAHQAPYNPGHEQHRGGWSEGPPRVFTDLVIYYFLCTIAHGGMISHRAEVIGSVSEGSDSDFVLALSC